MIRIDEFIYKETEYQSSALRAALRTHAFVSRNENMVIMTGLVTNGVAAFIMLLPPQSRSNRSHVTTRIALRSRVPNIRSPYNILKEEAFGKCLNRPDVARCDYPSAPECNIDVDRIDVTLDSLSACSHQAYNGS